MNKDIITSIRILPSDKITFSKESDFRFFIENTMIARGGDYYFPNLMMNCPKNTLVLFQYDGMIRAIGILVDFDKTPVVDERGEEYAGYYRFDTDTLMYLPKPLDKNMLKTAYPSFNGFSQSKQIIPLEHLDDILNLLQNTNALSLDDDFKVISEIENTNVEGLEKEALVKARVNQGVFRDKLLKKYSKCCLCGVSDTSFLIASHIKPWAESNDTEKLDIENTLLLCPVHDALFDKGFISFDARGRIKISKKLDEMEQALLNINDDSKIEVISNEKARSRYGYFFIKSIGEGFGF